MGVWGTGNFQNDEAQDVLATVSQLLKEQMAVPQDVEFIDTPVAAVATQVMLLKHCGGPCPELQEIMELRQGLLALYDAKIDGLTPSPEYKKDRRRAIVETFDDLIHLIESGDSAETGP